MAYLGRSWLAKDMQLTVKIVGNLDLRVVAGIFFGEYVAFLKVFGDIFMLSLQTTGLSYFMISFINRLGKE